MKELWCENCWSGVQGHDTRHCPHSTETRYGSAKLFRARLLREVRQKNREIAELDALIERLKR